MNKRLIIVKESPRDGQAESLVYKVDDDMNLTLISNEVSPFSFDISGLTKIESILGGVLTCKCYEDPMSMSGESQFVIKPEDTLNYYWALI